MMRLLLDLLKLLDDLQLTVLFWRSVLPWPRWKGVAPSQWPLGPETSRTTSQTVMVQCWLLTLRCSILMAMLA